MAPFEGRNRAYNRHTAPYLPDGNRSAKRNLGKGKRIIMLSNAQLKSVSTTQAFLSSYKNWRDCYKYHSVDLAAAAMPAEQQYFNVARAFGVCNLEKINQVSYPTLITKIGVQMFGTPVDLSAVSNHTEVVIQKDNRSYASLPTNNLPGGGIMIDIDVGIAAGVAQAMAAHGHSDDLLLLDTPIMISPDQNFRVLLRSDLTVLGAITTVMIILGGLEARTVI